MGEESVSKIDKLLTSPGEVPTATLRLQSQKVNLASMWSGVRLLSEWCFSDHAEQCWGVPDS